jgi:glutamyl-tRNA synthetase
MSRVRTRFAPSPTGNLNIGGVRAAIHAFLFAKHEGGDFILRIEDTDKERSKKEYEENIVESLKWLSILPDETYRQSENVGRHEELLRTLVAEDRAYVSKEEATEEGERGEVIRFRNKGEEVTFEDVIRGPITFDTTELGDFVIAKSFTEPVFHFAVVVDDADEGMTHVVRGDDHISNTPRQILIQRALGFPTPVYAHLPLILATDKTKLSKRKGAKALTEYRELGYLPEAIVNFDALLGWHPEGEEEIFTLEELIGKFTLDRVQKSPAVLDEEKLTWVNKEHMKKIPLARLAERAGVEGVDSRIVEIARERAETLVALKDAIEGELDFFSREPEIDPAILYRQGSETETKKHLTALLDLIEKIPEGASMEEVKDVLMPYADAIGKEAGGRGAALWPLRYALTGKERSPDPFTVISILDRKEVEKRIQRCI